MIKIFTLLSLFLTAVVSSVQSEILREVEFTVYGQYPLRNVVYEPIMSTELASESPVEIKTHILNRVGPYNFKGKDLITFFDKTTKRTVGSVRLPEGSSEWLLVFVKNPLYSKKSTKQNKFLIYPFDDSLKNLGNESLIFLNISGKELDGFLENKRIQLTAGESAPHSVQESIPINLWTRGYDGERLLQALVRTYQFEKDRRYLMIFFPPVLRGSIDLDVRVLEDEAK